MTLIENSIFPLRDSTIVSLADTGTSILAGVTIFTILGNLAYETGKPIESVVKGGTGLAFISYPEAISKFNSVPQVSSVPSIPILCFLTIIINLALFCIVLLDAHLTGNRQCCWTRWLHHHYFV